jgi:hypothetical protein
VVLRRLQKFRVASGKPYAWQYRKLEDDKAVIREGDVTPNEDGLLKIPQLPIDAKGGRLSIVPK